MSISRLTTAVGSARRIWVRNLGYTPHLRLCSPVITKEKLLKKTFLAWPASKMVSNARRKPGRWTCYWSQHRTWLTVCVSRFAHWDKNCPIREGERLSSSKMIFSYRMGIPVSYQWRQHRIHWRKISDEEHSSSFSRTWMKSSAGRSLIRNAVLGGTLHESSGLDHCNSESGTSISFYEYY